MKWNLYYNTLYLKKIQAVYDKKFNFVNNKFRVFNYTLFLQYFSKYEKIQLKI